MKPKIWSCFTASKQSAQPYYSLSGSPCPSKMIPLWSENPEYYLKESHWADSVPTEKVGWNKSRGRAFIFVSDTKVISFVSRFSSWYSVFYIFSQKWRPRKPQFGALTFYTWNYVSIYRPITFLWLLPFSGWENRLRIPRVKCWLYLLTVWPYTSSSTKPQFPHV